MHSAEVTENGDPDGLKKHPHLSVVDLLKIIKKQQDNPLLRDVAEKARPGFYRPRIICQPARTEKCTYSGCGGRI